MAKLDEISEDNTRKPWLITLSSLIVVGGLVSMPFIAGEPDGEKMPDIVRFVGRFHPLVLHLPIGVFSLILIQELGAIFGKQRNAPERASLFPMFFGAASAIVAVIAGFLLFHGEDYSGEIATRHLWGGLIFSVAAVLTFVVKAWTVSLSGNPAYFRLMLFGSVGIMAFASHDGASLTHGEDYLTKYAPAQVRQVLKLDGGKKPSAPAQEAQKPEDPLVYQDIVAPILEQRCVQCHKEGKAKGKLRMDSYEMLVKGGKSGAAFAAGDLAKSEMIVRIELPKDDDEHMPPEGKPDIEAHEVTILKWWITNGADSTKTLSQLNAPTEIKEAIAKLVRTKAPVGPSAETGAVEKATLPDAALQSSVANLVKVYPGALSFESQASSSLTFSAVSLRGNLDDAGFSKLDSLLSHLVTVDLSATKVTDQSVKRLVAASNLRMVRLAETGITDEAIDSLLKLPALESINLYGTKVTDVGVAKLSTMPKLKRLYLWQTAVTPELVKALREKLPSCEIVTGI